MVQPSFPGQDTIGVAVIVANQFNLICIFVTVTRSDCAKITCANHADVDGGTNTVQIHQESNCPSQGTAVIKSSLGYFCVLLFRCRTTPSIGISINAQKAAGDRRWIVPMSCSCAEVRAGSIRQGHALRSSRIVSKSRIGRPKALVG